MGYWEERKAAEMAAAQARADVVMGRLNRMYRYAYGDLKRSIERLKRRMGSRYGLSEAEVERFLAQPCGREEYLELLEQIRKIPEGNPIRRALEAKASSGAYAYRISRMDAQLDQVKAITASLAAEHEAVLTSHLMEAARNQASRAMFDIQQKAGVAWNSAGVSEGVIRKILYTDWEGANFSKRIWKNQEALAEAIAEVLGGGLSSGQSIRQMSEVISGRMGVSYAHARTLIRTETTNAVVQSDMAAMDEADIEKYEFVAVLDNKTSDVCQELDGQVFRREDAKPGVNLPPMHPNCRSIDAAYFDDEDYERLTRMSRDPVTGEPVKVPRTMKYKEWLALQEAHYGKERVALARKMDRNAAADRKQYERYKDRLGAHAPETFKAFQVMKYDDAQGYAQAKRAYETIGELKGKEQWSEAFRQKTIDGYWALREEGIEMSGHALSRYYDPKRNAGNAFSVRDFAALYRRGANYTQETDGRSVYFDGQHAIIENPENHVIVSFIYRRTIKDTWRERK